ncbi:unnamed protein product [Penicillium olsonii]|uniref:60S ribosomal protein L36 n=1 Tax=Penicillium olsonii TaxID=99116 RepID=A0A9W4HN19_PENOL|nr:unnamed protein product [Penicillium olsonii]CAG8065110.1 unnamed protein product [Penicillium olsonii]CAG8282306.1 unnamed protein product [Penicillium olsonii]
MVQERSGLILGLNSGRVRVVLSFPTLPGLLNVPSGLPVQSIGSFKYIWVTIYGGNTGESIGRMDCNNLDNRKEESKNGLVWRSSRLPTTALNTPKTRISRSKGKSSRRTAFVREIAQEVVGLAPYERRIIELLRNAQDKRARKLAKKRLGTFGRGKAKVENMQKVIAESRRAQAAGH